MERQGGIFVALGGAPDVWAEFDAARALLKGRSFGVVACNHSAIAFPGHLHGLATLHPEHVASWTRDRAERGGNTDFRAFVAAHHPNAPGATVIAQRWQGSSGLYAAQAAFDGLQATGVILCGVPMDPGAGHIRGEANWAGGVSYRKGFIDALPALGGRLRSLGGWTQALLGAPTPEWLAALDGAKPMRRPLPHIPTRPPMFTVTNVSQSAQKVQVIDPRGGFRFVWLQPGDSGAYDVDPAQARYQEGGALTAAPIAEVDAAPAKPAKPEPAPDLAPEAHAPTAEAATEAEFAIPEPPAPPQPEA